jgi:hypothetical protein
MELALQHIVNLSRASCAQITSHMAYDAQLHAFEKDDDPMLKLTLSVAAIASLSACMGDMGGESVSRNYTGPMQCDGFSGISATYINNNNGFPKRCGPQAQLPYSYR